MGCRSKVFWLERGWGVEGTQDPSCSRNHRMEGKAPTVMPRSSSLVCPFAAKGLLDGKHPNQQAQEGSPRPMNQACTARQIVCACGKCVCVCVWMCVWMCMHGTRSRAALGAQSRIGDSLPSRGCARVGASWCEWLCAQVVVWLWCGCLFRRAAGEVEWYHSREGGTQK